MAQSGKGRLNYRCPMCFLEIWILICSMITTKKSIIAYVANITEKKMMFWQRTN